MKKILIGITIITISLFANINDSDYKQRLMEFLDSINDKTGVGFICDDPSGSYVLFREDIKFYNSSKKYGDMANDFFFYSNKLNGKIFNIDKCRGFGNASTHYKK